MTTNEYLSLISALNAKINKELELLSEMKCSAISVSAVENKERVQTTPDHDRISSVICKIVEKEKQIDGLIDKYVNLKEKIKFQINLLSNEKHKFILTEKYVNGESIYSIAEKLKMTDRGCKKAHKRALEEFEKINCTKYCMYY